MLSYREHGQGTIEELRNRDFRKELEERERVEKDKGSGRRAIEPSRESATSGTKRQKLDQVPAASLDADDPLDEDESDSDSDEDDTAALLAELQKIKKERAAEQAKKVNAKLFVLFYIIRKNLASRQNYITILLKVSTKKFGIIF